MNRGDVTGGNQLFVGGGIPIGPQPQLVVQNVAGAVEIEVGVIRKVDQSRLVRRSFVIQLELIAIGQRVGDGCRKVAGVSFFSILAQVGEFDAGFLRVGRQHFRFPDFLSKTLVSTVNVVGAIVCRQRIVLPVQGESSLGDPVGDPSYDSGRCGKAVQVFLERISSKDNIGEDAIAVGNSDFRDDRAITHHFDDHAVLVAKRKQLDWRSQWCFSELFFCDSRHRSS